MLFIGNLKFKRAHIADVILRISVESGRNMLDTDALKAMSARLLTLYHIKTVLSIPFLKNFFNLTTGLKKGYNKFMI